MPLAPLYLGSLYVGLDECSRWVIKSVNRYDVVSYVNASFLQMFLLERFRALSPVPFEFKLVKPQNVVIDGVKGEEFPV